VKTVHRHTGNLVRKKLGQALRLGLLLRALARFAVGAGRRLSALLQALQMKRVPIGVSMEMTAVLRHRKQTLFT